jgi:hypothetical protein
MVEDNQLPFAQRLGEKADQRSTNQSDPQAIEKLKAQINKEEFLDVLHKLANHRGMGLDHEALEVAGTYAHAARIAQSFDSVAVAMPKLLESTVADIQAQQVQRDEVMAQILEQQQSQGQARSAQAAKEIETATRKLIGRSGNSQSRQFVFGSIGISIGMTIGMLISFFILFPNQLRQARLGDGAILEWLATPDGKLLYQTFKSGNRSVKACTKKAAAQKKNNKDLVCQITLR